MPGPTLYKTIAVVGVTMAMTSACLSSGSDSSSGGGGQPAGQAQV